MLYKLVNFYRLFFIIKFSLLDHFIKVDINNLHYLEKDLLPEKLAQIKYYAFVEEGDCLEAYIKELDFIEADLKNALPANTDYSIEKIDEENWNAKWETGFSPIKVNDFVAVRAQFHPAENDVKFDLIITPKMSFGTGHHATTFMMLQAMEHIDFINKYVIDFGAGTGVLAILAAKMGADKVLSIDNDKWSIESINENIEVNHCQNIRVMYAAIIPAESKVDIILANITLNVLSSSSTDIDHSLKVNGYLLVSGFFQDDVPAIESIFSNTLYKKITSYQREKWACVLYMKI